MRAWPGCLLVSVLVLAGCGSPPNRSSAETSADLFVSSGKTRAGEEHDGEPINRPRRIEVSPVCVYRREATITSVVPVKAQGPIRIIGWGTQRTLAGPRAPLDRSGSVTGRCGPGVHRSWDVVVELTASRPGRIIEFVVAYRSAGTTATAITPYVVTLCPAKCPRRWVDGDPFGRKVVP